MNGDFAQLHEFIRRFAETQKTTIATEPRMRAVTIALMGIHDRAEMSFVRVQKPVGIGPASARRHHRPSKFAMQDNDCDGMADEELARDCQNTRSRRRIVQERPMARLQRSGKLSL